MKITNEQSREIYELASNPAKRITNREIGIKFGINESSVRHHIKKWEKELKKISRNNAKVSKAVADFRINILEEAFLLMKVVKSGIQQAKNQGVSPERIAPLYSNWIKALEVIGNMELVRRVEKLEQVSNQTNQKNARK